MAIIHFLNVLEGDCSIIQHDSGRVTVIDVSNAYDSSDSDEEKKVKEVKENEIKKRNYVPNDKINYRQKEWPDNPIDYLTRLKIKDIHRFIITHPDMDHLDGLKDFYNSFKVWNTWDSDNTRENNLNAFPGKFNPEDWKFYLSIRNGKYTGSKRLVYHAGDSNQYYNEDNIQILAPSRGLVDSANSEGGDIHDLSYVLLFRFPRKGGKEWKIIFGGDSDDNSWDYIIENYEADVKNVDILFAPHHGRDSGRKYDFLEVLTPDLTLFGNASSEHLAYSCYPEIRITNNQAGYVVLDINEDRIEVYVKHKQFAVNFRNNRGLKDFYFNQQYDAYYLGSLEA